ncbi:hypothetical protein JCM8097_003337 [Rhodosporidiobolus ruineniae]
MAPYASTYVPPPDALPANHGGPVSITLALGPGDLVQQEDEWMEDAVDTEAVLDAVRHLRDEDGEASMAIDLPWELEGGQESGGLVVVVDTNILISHLSLLNQLIHLASTSSSSPSFTLLIPHIVLQELDGLKTSSRSTDVTLDKRRTQTSISSLARAATNWLLQCLSGSGGAGNGVVRGQRKSETLLGPAAAKGGRGDNDSLVLDAALFFREREAAGGVRVVLLSDDNNLRLRATFEQVEAVGIDPKGDAASLLERLGRPVKRRSSSPRRSILPETTKAVPIPLSAPAPSASMEIDDAPEPPPLHASLLPPLLVPVRTRADVFRNLSTLVAHFLALPLYRHVHEHLRRTQPSVTEQRRWMDELGDWRLWEAKETVEAAKRWWSEGGVAGLCKSGFEHAEKGAMAAPVPLDPPRPPSPPPALPPPARPTGRAASSSRWATPTRASATPSRAALPPPPPPLPPLPARRRPSPPVPRRLSDLSLSLSPLLASLSTPPHTAASWSAPRWEVLLDSTAELLLAVLSGAMRDDVSAEVRSIVGAWVGELESTGMRVEVLSV